jgi:hypothetical protein
MNQLNENIRKLLELWFNGSTSLQEEEQLRTYFTKGPVAPDLMVYRGLFLHFEDEKHITSPMEEDLGNTIQQHQSSLKKKRVLNIMYTSIGIAAIFLAVFAWVSIFDEPPPPKPSNQPSAEEVIKAYAETARVLGMVSEKLNQGMKPMTQLAKIGEGQKTMNVISNIGKGMEILNHLMPGSKKSSPEKSETKENQKL